ALCRIGAGIERLEHGCLPDAWLPDLHIGAVADMQSTALLRCSNSLRTCKNAWCPCGNRTGKLGQHYLPFERGGTHWPTGEVKMGHVSGKRGFFRNAVNALVAAREKQAQ